MVILSEAGTGKTAEIRNIARTLRVQGRPAFFLRLEHIPQDFEDAFEIGAYENFEEWLASAEEGWLLLDSVDEARLRHPLDFELAIRKLGRRIQSAKDRTHIVITGRTTAWRPKTDLAHCKRHLSYGSSAQTKRDPQAEDDIHEGVVHTQTVTAGQAQSDFRIVAFDDLTREQIAVFVEARGIKNSKSFLDAVERADAWAFTSRPQDLEELTGFWIDKGRIGTRLELIRNSIDRRLAERDQDRADGRPLSAERVRQGTRLLAASTTLTKDSTIRIPDGSDNTKGIAVQSVLTEWDDQEISTLLSRPIFDEAIYGTVRFHHRSVREYLTAEWFAELLKRETSRRTIETLFFRNQYGLDIVVPSLRPILPWLAILDDKIGERVRKIAPEIIFEGGDPSQLPLSVRRNILREICRQMADGSTGHSVQQYGAVQRFASPDLTDDVRALLEQYANHEELTAFLLRMVWLGQLVGAQPETMNIALSPNAERYVRISAFRAMKSIGSKEDIDLIRQSFLTEAPILNGEWLAELIEDEQPTEQTVDWFLACLKKIEPIDEYAVNHLEINTAQFVGATDLELLPRLVAGLNGLLNLSPMIERRYCEVSERFQWLMAPACEAVKRLIMARHPATLKPDALAILHKYASVRGYGNRTLDENEVKFSEIIPAWKDLNRTLFWFEIQRSREILANKSGRTTD